MFSARPIRTIAAWLKSWLPARQFTTPAPIAPIAHAVSEVSNAELPLPTAMLSKPEFTKSVKPIFIIGAPRSGTSIMTWALGQHPNIQPMPETGWIASLAVGSYLSFEKGSERGQFSHLSNVNFPLTLFMRRLGEAVDAIVQDCFEERCQAFYGDYKNTKKLKRVDGESNQHLQIRRAINDPKCRWIDGTPLNSHFLWALSEMFPEALFIHNLRQPHEVVASLEGFAKVGANPQDLSEGLQTWMSHTENAWYAERALGAKKVYRLNFERITRDPESLLKELCSFLGEEYCADCLIPLSQRLNSSEVDDRREESIRRLNEIPAYQSAKRLFNTVLSQPAAMECDLQAQYVFRQRFIDYCRDRPLV